MFKKSCLIFLSMTFLLADLAAADPRTAQMYGPQISPKGVIFRYYLPHAKSVRLAGDFNGWTPNILLEQGEKPGSFQVTVPIFQRKKYRYKLVVDSIWQHDPTNPNREYDLSGDEISWFEIPRDLIQYGANPEKVGWQEYRFYYKNNAADHVALVGSFNNYNPYDAIMERDEQGVWSIRVQVPPGKHHYCFVVDGRWRTDPERRERSWNRFGQEFSRFIAD